MSDSRFSKRSKALLVLAAIILMIIPALALSPNVVSWSNTSYRPIVGGLFSALCIGGLIAAIYPARCKRMFGGFQKPKLSNSQVIPIVGHHPDCEKYNPNRIDFVGKRICAACAGLLVGAVVALCASVSYFFIGMPSNEGSISLLFLSEGFIILGLVQIYFKSYLKALANLLFVVGATLVIIEVDVFTKNFKVDLYMLTFVAFMLYLRIHLSEWHNRRTCQNCNRCF